MRHAGGGIVPLAVHGEGYKEIENAAMWNAKETALKDIPHIVTTAGTLDGCKRFYICIELPGAAFSAAGEAFREYLCLVTSHDGSMAAQAFISRIRIVCNNTFTAAEAGTSCRFKLKHTKNVDIELPGLHKFIADAHAGRVTFQTNYQQAKDTAISPDRAYAAITGYFYQRTIGRKNDTTGKAGNPRLSTRARNQIDEIFQAFRYGQGNDGRNVADLINGFTEHYTSGTGTGITKEGREMTEGERKVVSTWGAAAEVKTEVTRLLLQPDGTALQELVTIGETKGLDAYLEGTGVSRPVFMSGLDRARSKTAPAPVRAIDFSGEATPAPVVTPVPSNGGSILDDLLGKPFAPKQ
jgi:hypothetical protein